MNDTPSNAAPNALDQIMDVFLALQTKIASLEKKVQNLETKNTEIENALANLDLWHNSRIFGRISRIFPKSRSVIFYHRDFFSDNIKYAYLKFLETAQQQGIPCRFLIHNAKYRDVLMREGLPCFPPPPEWTMDDYNQILSAKVLVVQDDFAPYMWHPTLSYCLLQGAKLVQLWHGLPMKEIGVFYQVAPAKHEFKFAATGPADVLIAPGSSMKEEWKRLVAHRQFAPVGYPRNDVLLRDPTPHELINVDADLWRDVQAAFASGRKVIFYAPTFRDKGGLAWFEQAGIDRFSQWCREKGPLFIAKLHPMDQEASGGLAAKIPDIRFAGPQSDIYPLLRYVHTLVTDYSSLMFDFLLLDRPILFYRPDHAEYLLTCRNLLPDFERFTVGPVAENVDALCRVADEALSGNPDAWGEARRALRKELFDHHDANAGDRVVNVILKQLDVPDEMPTGWAP